MVIWNGSYKCLQLKNKKILKLSDVKLWLWVKCSFHSASDLLQSSKWCQFSNSEEQLWVLMPDSITNPVLVWDWALELWFFSCVLGSGHVLLAVISLSVTPGLRYQLTTAVLICVKDPEWFFSSPFLFLNLYIKFLAPNLSFGSYTNFNYHYYYYL